MKNYKKILSSVLVGTMALGLSSCRDDWSKENDKPSSLPSATAEQLLTTAEFRMYPHGYTLWFYSGEAWFKTTQMLGFSGSYTNSRLIGIDEGRTPMMINQLRYFTALEHEMASMSEDKKEQAKPFLEAVRVLAIYGGIYDADCTGDMPYTEGARGAYDAPQA